MDSTLEEIPISAIQAYHSKERRLFSRMVLDLHMDPIRSMEIIAFWLWLEEQKKIDFIDQIITFDDFDLQAVALSGQDCVVALRLDALPDQLAIGFQKNAVNGIKYYLNSVCLKAFNDIRRKAEEVARIHQMEMLAHQVTCMRLESVNGSQMIPSFPHRMDSVAAIWPLHFQRLVPNGKGSSSCISNASFQPLGILDVESEIQSGYPFNKGMLGQRPSTWQIPQVGSGLPIMAHNINTGIGVRRNYQMTTEASQQPRDNIPSEERTLFVTFSNGYPLTKEELYNFFMRHYGDVELVNVQTPKEGEPPQYAYVSFFKLATVFRVLNGTQKARFITNGKHLWARRFIPKKNPYNEEIGRGFGTSQ